MLPVFGSVASATISSCAGSPRASRSAKPGSKHDRALRRAALEQRLEHLDRAGTTAIGSNTPAAANRLRIASVTASGAGSTIASRTWSTSVRIA